MKHKLLLAISTATLCSFMLKPFAYTLSAVDPAKGTVKAILEKSTAMIQTKGKTSTTSSSYTISNAKSLVRIKIGDAVFNLILTSQPHYLVQRIILAYIN